MCCLLAAMALGCGSGGRASTDEVGLARLAARRDGLVWTKQGKLVGSQTSAFGYSVALSGDTALGADLFELDDEQRASAYAFTRTGTSWSEGQKLTVSGSVAKDDDGKALAVSGDTAFVGAPGCSCVYVLSRRDGRWYEQQKLTAEGDTTLAFHFGRYLSLSRDSLLVGADDAAYVFTRTGTVWSEQQKLTITPFVRFGAGVSLSGDTAVIGGEVADGFGRGAVYVFTRTDNVWTEQQRLIGPDGAADEFFGSAIALEGDTLFVSTFNWARAAGEDPVGAAHVFTRTGNLWSYQQTLTAKNGEKYDGFGSALALSGETAVVSAPGTDNGGSAYVFTRSGTTWSQDQELRNSGSFQFGFSLALSDDTLLVGSIGDGSEAPDNMEARSETGAVYVFALGPDVPDSGGGQSGAANGESAGGQGGSANGESDSGTDAAGNESAAGESGSAGKASSPSGMAPARGYSARGGGCQVVRRGSTGWSLVALSGALLLLRRRRLARPSQC